MSLRADAESEEMQKSLIRRWVTPITASALLLALTTFGLWLLAPGLQQDHLIFIYFVPTALIAIRYGSVSAMCVTIASTFAAAYLLYTPQFSFMVENTLDLMEMILFSLLALLASQVVSGFASDSEVKKRRVRVPAASRRRWPPLWTQRKRRPL